VLDANEPVTVTGEVVPEVLNEIEGFDVTV
jgi:hypothetical protein